MLHHDSKCVTFVHSFSSHNSILSFGAPQPNVYKIVVDGRDAMLFVTNQVCIEFIANQDPFVLYLIYTYFGLDFSF